MPPLVEVRQLRFRYGRSERLLSRTDEWTLKSVDLSIAPKATVGIVGETGSGKSTLVRVLCGLLPVRSGAVSFDGRAVSDWLRVAPREFRRRNQMVFQSPASSFDPRMRLGRSVAEAVKAIERRTPSEGDLAAWLAQVGLDPGVLSRYPHEVSGGQLQRMAIARAISVNPSVLYADEPTSALDVSVQAQVLNLLMALRVRLGLTLVMVSHDLAVVGRVCEQVVVMKDGEVVETGPTVDLLRNPRSDYTASLIEAADAVSLTATGRSSPPPGDGGDSRLQAERNGRR